jgi:pimeloyl-ACP methyl ester carboxylesterase
MEAAVPTREADEVILLHGLWFGAWAMAPLARRLKARGFSVRRFRYRPTRAALDEHARALRVFAKDSPSARQHFVAHSLGGLVVLRMLTAFESPAPGRVVLLGSPLKGSIAAHKAARIPGSSVLLGEARDALRDGYAAPPAKREVGMIAGTRSVGLGWLVGGLDGPGDGTVAVSETQVDGLAAHVVVPVSHTGLVYSRQVAQLTADFLENGHFAPPLA